MGALAPPTTTLEDQARSYAEVARSANPGCAYRTDFANLYRRRAAARSRDFVVNVMPLKWQRNTLFKAVEAGGLNAWDCTYAYDEAETRITHVPSQSYFLIKGDPPRCVTTAVVGDVPSFSLDAFIWDTVIERVRHWAKQVKDDVNTTDLWAELKWERQILTGARYEDVENTPFSSDERAEIANQIRQLKEFVKTTNSLSEAQMLSVTAKLDDLETASCRIGRKDWLLMFCGVLLSLIVADLVPPEVVRGIFTIALHGLDYLFSGGALPPKLPPATWT